MEQSSPSRNPYLTRERLAEMIQGFQVSGKVSEDLGLAVLAIAGGVWDRYRYTTERDDFCQSVVLHLIGNPLRRCDTSKNPFSYLTTCAIRLGGKLRSKRQAEGRGLEKYRGLCAEIQRRLTAHHHHIKPPAEEE